MKTPLLLCLLPLLLFGCASKKGTTLYNPRTGALLAEFHADMLESEYVGPVRWKVKGHYPSANTAARGAAYSQVLGVVGKQAQMFTVPGVP